MRLYDLDQGQLVYQKVGEQSIVAAKTYSQIHGTSSAETGCANML